MILSSGYVHPSAMQAISMAGLGRANVRRLARDGVGRLDLEALAAELAEAGPAIVIANAGEVNAGDFDPLAEIAELTEANDAWLHVDGAFGLFARLAPESRGLTAGIERADSVTVDCHKWLNVPYDCGVAFVREPDRLARALNFGAPYLPRPDDPRPNFGFIAPESSRRSRALNVWATLARLWPLRLPGDGRAPPGARARTGRAGRPRARLRAARRRATSTSSASGPAPRAWPRTTSTTSTGGSASA